MIKIVLKKGANCEKGVIIRGGAGEGGKKKAKNRRKNI